MEEKKKRLNTIINAILILILVLLVVILILHQYVLSLMRVEGESMMPTLRTREIVLVHRTKAVKPQDIVVFRDHGKLLVKRVIASGGDKVAVTDDGYVYINGERIEEDYIYNGKHNDNDMGCDYDLATDEIFVLGDNRCNSNDSQDYGPIKIDAIIGRVLK